MNPSPTQPGRALPPQLERAAQTFPDLVFLRGLIDGLRCGILSVDIDGRLLLLNETARRILDLGATPEAGTPLWQALARYPELVRVLSSCFAMKSLPSRAELELGDGRGRRSIGFTLSLIRDDNGDPCGAAMFFKDLVPIERQAEQERLKDRLAALGQMAACMAHEIRNPLASIDVTAKLLGRRIPDDTGCLELLARISSEVSRLNRSVDSCLSYVRPVSLALACADLALVLEEAIRAAGERCPSPGVEIVRNFEAPLPPFLMDRELLRQAFVNLVLNALEAVGKSGRVTVEARVVEAPGAASIPLDPEKAAGDPWSEARRYAFVSVRDTGPGIEAEDLDRVFHPFFTTKEQGSGVGLALAKKLVHDHRGWIEVISAPGQGAEILVHLPMVEARADRGVSGLR